MKKVEILAPAGSMESLIAAMNKGADAIYLGGNKFSARAYASNFDNDNMIKAVDYAHSYGAKVYVTLNTILKENEIEEAVRYVGFLYEIGVDAIIIQDLGLFKRVKEDYPDFEIHASTQMTIHNGEGALFFKEKGFHRIVLSRELSLDEIKYILNQAKTNLKSYKLPITPKNFYVELSEAAGAISDMVLELDKRPISIKTLNTRVDTARDLTLKVYNTTKEAVKTAKMAEAAIVYGNRYRALYKDVELGLIKAENAFYKGNFKISLENAINAINIVEPGIHKKLLEEYQ